MFKSIFEFILIVIIIFFVWNILKRLFFNAFYKNFPTLNPKNQQQQNTSQTQQKKPNQKLNWDKQEIKHYLKENLNIIKNFYPNSQYECLKRNGGCTVMSVVLDCIGNKQYKNAMKWMIVFNEEINKYTKLFDVENLHTPFNFKKLLTNQIKYLKESSSSYNMSYGILENILKNENWFKFMDSYELFENLSDKLQPKPKTKPTKI